MKERIAQTTLIKAVSKCTVKIKDNFYSVEYSEERSLPENVDDNTLDNERRLLWEDVNKTVDEQVIDIVNSFKK